MQSFTFFVIACLALAFPFSAKAKESTKGLDQVLAENSRVVEALVAYPAEVRQAVLEASLHPNTLFAMGQEQQQTSAAFQRLISPYPRETQEKVYNLVRYPNLVDALVAGGEKSTGQIQALTRGYPREVQEAAQDLGRKESLLLQNIHALYTRSTRAFEKTLQGLPASSQMAYRTLLRYPEVLETLAEHWELALALGEAYRLNPRGTQAQLNDWSESVARQNAEALEDYRETLKKDPKAREELQQSAQEFAQHYGYYGDVSAYPPPARASGTAVVTLHVKPYPYWFGYPYWYASPFWRPYPLWYLTGFSLGYGGGFVVWGWPSFWYTQWFFGYPAHFYRYPYLASCYGSYYYRWRHYPLYSGFHRVVRSWHHHHRHHIHNDLWRHDHQRVARWRDFGQREEVQSRRPVSQHPAFQLPERTDQQGLHPRHPDTARRGIGPPAHGATDPQVRPHSGRGFMRPDDNPGRMVRRSPRQGEEPARHPGLDDSRRALEPSTARGTPGAAGSAAVRRPSFGERDHPPSAVTQNRDFPDRAQARSPSYRSSGNQSQFSPSPSANRNRSPLQAGGSAWNGGHSSWNRSPSSSSWSPQGSSRGAGGSSSGGFRGGSSPSGFSGGRR